MYNQLRNKLDSVARIPKPVPTLCFCPEKSLHMVGTISKMQVSLSLFRAPCCALVKCSAAANLNVSLLTGWFTCPSSKRAEFCQAVCMTPCPWARLGIRPLCRQVWPCHPPHDCQCIYTHIGRYVIAHVTEPAASTGEHSFTLRDILNSL